MGDNHIDLRKFAMCRILLEFFDAVWTRSLAKEQVGDEMSTYRSAFLYLKNAWTAEVPASSWCRTTLIKSHISNHCKQFRVQSAQSCSLFLSHVTHDLLTANTNLIWTIMSMFTCRCSWSTMRHMLQVVGRVREPEPYGICRQTTLSTCITVFKARASFLAS